MPMKTSSRVLVAVLFLAPSVCTATETLDCIGEAYGASFHVGSEGIADFTLFGPDEPLASGGIADLEIERFEWYESGDYSKNVIIVRAKKGFSVPFKLAVNGERGSIEVRNVTAPVFCDWKK